MRVETGRGLGKDKNRHYTLYLFDNLDDYVRDAQRTAPEFWGSSGHEGKRQTWSDRDFYATESYDEAVELAMNGWREPREQVEGFLAPIRQKVAETLSNHIVRVHDLTGYEPDIDRFIAGELECMWDDLMVEEPHNGKVFTLLVDASMTWNNHADDILRRGAALCGLVEAYNVLGFQLEVWVEQTVRSYSDDYASFLTRVNNAGDPLDIDRLMFAIGHGDYNRRLGWRIGEGKEVMRDKFGFRQGHGYGTQRNGAHHAERVGAHSTVTLDGNRTMLDGAEWVLQQLEEQGLWEQE